MNQVKPRNRWQSPTPPHTVTRSPWHLPGERFLFDEQTRPARPEDLPRLAALQATESNALGFLTRTAIAVYIKNGRVLVYESGPEIVGYLIFNDNRRHAPPECLVKIWQIVTVKRLRRRHIATTLLNHVIAEARAAGFPALQAKVAKRLDATSFWKHHRFIPIAYLCPPNARRRVIICYRLPLQKTIPAWIAYPQHTHQPAREPRP